MNYRKCVSPIMTRTQIVVGTQVRAQSKDFAAVSQTDLTRVQFPLWRKLLKCLSFYTPETWNRRSAPVPEALGVPGGAVICLPVKHLWFAPLADSQTQTVAVLTTERIFQSVKTKDKLVTQMQDTLPVNTGRMIVIPVKRPRYRVGR